MFHDKSKLKKKPSLNKSFGLLAGCPCLLKGTRRQTQGQLCCQRRQLQTNSTCSTSGQRFERLDNAYLKDTYIGNTNPLFHSEHLSFYVDTFTWIMYSWKLSFQILLLQCHSFFQLTTIFSFRSNAIFNLKLWLIARLNFIVCLKRHLGSFSCFRSAKKMILVISGLNL